MESLKELRRPSITSRPLAMSTWLEAKARTNCAARALRSPGRGPLLGGWARCSELLGSLLRSLTAALRSAKEEDEEEDEEEEEEEEGGKVIGRESFRSQDAPV